MSLNQQQAVQQPPCIPCSALPDFESDDYAANKYWAARDGQRLSDKKRAEIDEKIAQGKMANISGVTRVVTNPCTGDKTTILPYQPVQKPTLQYAQPHVLMASGFGPQLAYGPPRIRSACQNPVEMKPPPRTQCYTCAPKRADGYPQDPKCYGSPIFIDAFDGFDIGNEPGYDWNWFGSDEGPVEFIAKDASIRVDRGTDTGGVVLKSGVFKNAFMIDERKPNNSQKAGFLDGFKAFALANSEPTIPDCGQLFVKSEIAAVISGADNAHDLFPGAQLDPDSDLRLAHSALVVVDLDSGLWLSIALTNSTIFAVYGVMPLGEAVDRQRSVFLAAWPIGQRNLATPASDFVRVGIAIDNYKNQGIFYINDSPAHTVHQLGSLPNPDHILFQSGINSPTIKVNSVRFGFGNFTLLNAFPPNVSPRIDAMTRKPYKALVRTTLDKVYIPRSPVTDYLNQSYQENKLDTEKYFYENDAPLAKRNFGQGATLYVKYIKVENRK